MDTRKVEPTQLTVAVAITYVNYQDKSRWDTQDVAIRQMLTIPYLDVINVDYAGSPVPPYRMTHRPILVRNSAITIGNTRPLPYIKDIVQSIQDAPVDIIGYVNSDILLGKHWEMSIRNHPKVNAWVMSRYEILPVTVEEFTEYALKQPVLMGPDHCGRDGFFFRRSWWLENHQKFNPDYIVGESMWDTAWQTIIHKLPENEYLDTRCLYHVQHPTIWEEYSPGAKNNKTIAGIDFGGKMFSNKLPHHPHIFLPPGFAPYRPLPKKMHFV